MEKAFRVVVIAAGVSSSVGLCSAQSPSEAVIAAYGKYCPGGDETFDGTVAEVVALGEEGRSVFVEMASAGPPMQACAWALLVGAKDRRVIPILTEYMARSDNDLSERHWACRQATLFPDVGMAEAALSVIDSELESDTPRVALCAIGLLGEVDDDRARGRLRALLRLPSELTAENRGYQITVLEALSKAGDAAATPKLLALATSTHSMVSYVERGLAGEALGRIGTRESVAPLMDVVRSLPVAGNSRFLQGRRIADGVREASERTADGTLRRELEALSAALQIAAREEDI